MRNRLLPLALLSLALLAAGLWVAFRGGERGPGRERAAVRPPAAAAPDGGRAEARPLELADAPGAADETPAPEAAAAKPARVVASTDYEDELARALWVEGRVAIPADTPLDERVKVVAKGRKFEHGPEHSAEVAADGTFRVAFSERTKTGRLELEARYLYLHEPLKVAPGAGEPVVLEALLGGVLRGRVVPPPDAPGGAEALVGRQVQLHGWKRTDGSGGSLNINRSEKLDASLEFAFTALPSDVTYTLRCDAQVYEPADADELLAPPGGETVVELEMQAGVSVAGRVVDESGAPVAGAAVHARVESGRATWGRLRQAVTGADGAFTLRGITSGAITLEASSKGREPLELLLGRLEHGAERSGVELRLARGSSISGRVLWPDGTPAEGASVSAEPKERDEDFTFRIAGQAFAADASGAFTITGLEPGPHRISARATRKERVMERSELLGREREKTVRTTLRASLDGVEAGASGLVLQLSDGEALRGVVVDDLGTPIEDFAVSASSVERQGRTTHYSHLRRRTFKDTHGAFELTGLAPGLVRLEFEAEGHSAPSDIEVEVPLQAELPPIRLTRAARVSGVVLTPVGEPAPRAQIETTGHRERHVGFVFASVAGAGESYRDAGVADAQGRFETDDTGLGAIKLRASSPGYAPSEPLALELVPGGPQEGIVLRLREGVRLTGLVVDAAGKGAPLRRVEVTRSQKHTYGLRSETTAFTDEAGAFEVAGLEPGTYSAALPPTEAELAALGISASDGAREALTVKTEVEVTASGGHVVLTASAARTVRVFGTITAGGEAASAHLTLNPRGGGTHAWTETDGAGAYEVVVAAPGDYRLGINLENPENGRGASISQEVAIQGPAEQRLDVDIPVGAIEGRVLGPDGPVDGIEVELQRLEGGARFSGHASTLTDGHGRYAAEQLPAGAWAVQAGGGEFFSFSGGPQPAPYTLARVDGIVVASGQRVRDVDLRVGAAGSVSGSVRTAEGEPAAGALVMARLPADPTAMSSAAQVDGQGNFSLGGLAPGTWTLGVLHGWNQGVEATVEVEAGKQARVELRLAPATLVRVVVRDATGAPAQAHVTCTRSDGADFSAWHNWFLAAEKAPEGERRIGPLPPGTYTVKADREGATPSTKTVTLDGEPEVLVELVL